MISSICLVLYLILYQSVTHRYPDNNHHADSGHARVAQPLVLHQVYPSHDPLINKQQAEPDPNFFIFGPEHQPFEQLRLYFFQSHTMSGMISEADAL